MTFSWCLAETFAWEAMKICHWCPIPIWLMFSCMDPTKSQAQIKSVDIHPSDPTHGESPIPGDFCGYVFPRVKQHAACSRSKNNQVDISRMPSPLVLLELVPLPRRWHALLLAWNWRFQKSLDHPEWRNQYVVVLDFAAFQGYPGIVHLADSWSAKSGMHMVSFQKGCVLRIHRMVLVKKCEECGGW